MVRFEKDKLIIVLDCSNIDPREELVSIYQDFLAIVAAQDKDYTLCNKYAMDHMLRFLSEIMPQAEQIKTKTLTLQ